MRDGSISARRGGGWGPLYLRNNSGALISSISIVPLGDSELWVEGRLFLGSESPVHWTQGPYSALTGTVSLDLPNGLSSALAALQVRVLAKDPETGALRSVRNAERVYLRKVGAAISVFSEGEAQSATGLSMQPGEDGLIEEGLVGREVTP